MMSTEVQEHVDEATLAEIRAARALKAYLDEIGYHGIYKYLVAANWYAVSPSRFSQLQPVFLKSFDKHLVESDPEWKLAEVLTTCQLCPLSSLDEAGQELAEILVDGGLLRLQNGHVSPAGRQLISVCDRYLLIDARIHFHSDQMHEVYIGPDTYMLLHYLPNHWLTQGHRALDLCTGTGVIGQALARYCGEVVSTDIAPAPLKLARLNRALNANERTVEIRVEDLRETLSSPELFDLIACNPPFVASPRGLPSPIYAEGPDADGLGYLRLLLEQTPDKLTSTGESIFVADLPGNADRPYFCAELERAALSQGLFIEAYIDQRLPGEMQIEPFVFFLGRLHPDVSLDEIRQRTRQFIQEDIKAHFYYLTTIRIRKRGRRGLRILNRYRITDFDAFFFGNL